MTLLDPDSTWARGLLRRRGRRRFSWWWVVVLLGAIAFFTPRFRRVPIPENNIPTDRLLLLRPPELPWTASRADVEEGGEGGGFAMPVSPSYVEGTIGRGQGLTVAARDLGVAPEALAPVVAALGQIFDFRRSQPGDRFEIELSSTGTIHSLRYIVSPELRYEARRVGDKLYDARQIDVALDVRTEVVSGSIASSFYASMSSLGEGEALARRVVSVFQWDIDFSRDVRPGDAFRILVEKVYLEGNFLRYGQVLAAEYRGGRVQESAYYFAEPGHEGFYTEEAVPLQRMFLAAPCRYRRISSRFDPNRMHPVMNRRVPHLGVDYAADTGTPVWATADGVISHRGFNSRAGNLVKVRHANGYETAYAHLSRFATGLREGQTVKQGDVIGFVGNTGMSTGPHLHYGLRVNGAHVDPLSRRDSRGRPLDGRALNDFQRRVSQYRSLLDQVALPTVARLEEDPEEFVDTPLDLPDDLVDFPLDEDY